jgi:ribosomal protein L39E
MGRTKHLSKKLRLAKTIKSAVAAPFWAILKKFGKRKVYRWRLNPHKRRNWRGNKLKI